MLDSSQILTVSGAIHDKCALAANVDFVFPTATRFTSKADYWAFVDTTKDTQTEIETDLINAVWVSYLRFADDDRTKDSPVKSIVYEITLFTESTFERLDETATPDPFNAKVSLTDHEHDTAVFSLQTQFQGLNPLGLDTAVFTVAETISLAQIDNTQRETFCEFVPDTVGSVTKFECLVNIQLVAC